MGKKTETLPQFEIIDRLGQRHRFDHATHFWAWADEAERDIAVFRRCEDEDAEEVKRFLFPLVVGDVSPDICMSMPLMSDGRVAEAIASGIDAALRELAASRTQPAAQPVDVPEAACGNMGHRQGLSDEQLKRALTGHINGYITNTVRAIALDVQTACADAWGVKLEGGK